MIFKISAVPSHWNNLVPPAGAAMAGWWARALWRS